MSRAARVAWTTALRVAIGCAAIALVADVGLLARAARSRDEERIVPLRIAPAAPIAPRKTDARGLIESAGARRPFEPLGGTKTLASAGTVIPQAVAIPAAQPRLIGTVVGGAESFVVMAMTDGAIKVVRLGERAGDLKLRSVSAGGAIFDDIHGGRVTLRSPTPGSEPQP
ncbi:MAG: hypothetical protein JWL95_141 [Gemmatimonadetes bacterium]|nr:hypothetical protein [Gemmatimonadota bacterium]